MGDYRLSLKLSLSGAEKQPGDDDEYQDVKPLDWGINYHPDKQEEILNAIEDYLDKAWAAAQWNYDEDYRRAQKAQAKEARKRRVEALRQQLAAAEAEAAQDE